MGAVRRNAACINAISKLHAAVQHALPVPLFGRVRWHGRHRRSRPQDKVLHLGMNNLAHCVECRGGRPAQIEP